MFFLATAKPSSCIKKERNRRTRREILEPFFPPQLLRARGQIHWSWMNLQLIKDSKFSWATSFHHFQPPWVENLMKIQLLINYIPFCPNPSQNCPTISVKIYDFSVGISTGIIFLITGLNRYSFFNNVFNPVLWFWSGVQGCYMTGIVFHEIAGYSLVFASCHRVPVLAQSDISQVGSSFLLSAKTIRICAWINVFSGKWYRFNLLSDG